MAKKWGCAGRGRVLGRKALSELKADESISMGLRYYGGKGVGVVEEWSKNAKEGTDNKAIRGTRSKVGGWKFSNATELRRKLL